MYAAAEECMDGGTQPVGPEGVDAGLPKRSSEHTGAIKEIVGMVPDPSRAWDWRALIQEFPRANQSMPGMRGNMPGSSF